MSGIDYAQVLAVINADPNPPEALASFVEQERAHTRYRAMTGMDEPPEERARRARLTASRTPLLEETP